MTDGSSNPAYRKAIELLNELQWFGAKPGLESTRKLADLAGRPERRLRFIHVAGTNGKGSTCAILESIYRKAGLRVGLFTSPHLVSFRERIQINRRLISEADVVRLADEMRPLLQQFTQEQHPTFFETVTIMALRYFADQKCDLVIWETGLGGRLDATNIVTPIASVITNIQYDHQKWLGETLASIASEKAGIIKRGIPVITGVDVSEARGVIEAAARQNESSLFFAKPFDSFPINKSDCLRSLPGEHQKQNAALALTTVEVLQNVIPVPASAIEAGLRDVHWLGRLQVISGDSGNKLLLDGAHNVSGAEALAAALKTLTSEPITLILGVLGDKDWRGMCQILCPVAARILLVPVQDERAAPPVELERACKACNPRVPVQCCDSLEAALRLSENDSFVAIAGSLYLIGEAMELRKLSTETPLNERRLNEWTAKPRAAK
jgi:dihydrofolate synthase/folylpolyglutamate synthase